MIWPGTKAFDGNRKFMDYLGDVAILPAIKNPFGSAEQIRGCEPQGQVQGPGWRPPTRAATG
jgi:hypothetical protein